MSELTSKLVACDVDGTLLDSNGRLRERTKEALSLASEAGATITLATGRDWLAVEYLLKELPSVSYAICVNGAEVRTSNGEKLYSHEIGKDLANQIIGKTRDSISGVSMGASINGRLVAEQRLADSLPPTPKGVESFAEKVVPDLLTELDQNVQDLVIYHQDFENKLDDLFALVCSFVDMEGVAVTYSGLPMIEILPLESGKDSALSWLAKHLEISKDQVVAFGDNMNDVSMLRWAGLGVAMGNSSLELLKYADQITLTNDQDGVAAWIEMQLSQ